MKNHDEKRRDICRSILPSTSRRAARTNASILKRQHRRHIRLALADWATYDDYDDYEGFVHEDTNRPITGGVGAYYGSTIKEIVWERRAHDKVSSLVRWVERIKDDLPGETDDEKFEALRAMLPDNLIGRHALSHVDQLFDLNDGHTSFWWRYGRRTRDYESEAEEFLTFVGEVREHCKTNLGYINAVFAGLERCEGIHDVDRFATSVARSSLSLKLMRRILDGERVRPGLYRVWKL